MLIDTKEAASRMNVCIRTILRWIAKGELPAQKYGHRTIRISEDDLQNFMKAHQTGK